MPCAGHHACERAAPGFAERDTNVELIRERMRAAETVGAGEAVLEVVTELVCDDVAVVLVGVLVGRAYEEDSGAESVAARADLTGRGACNGHVGRAPVQLQGREHRSRAPR